MHRLILKAARALVGPELEPVEPGTIAVERGRVLAPDDASVGEVVELGDVTLLPGFIDTHVHIGLADPRSVLQGGVTAVRDLGWPPARIYPLVRASNDPGWGGPSIRCAGPMLTVAEGYPTRAAWAPPGTARVVSSPDQGEAIVDEEIRRGSTVVKVSLNAQVGPTLDSDTLTRICAVAHDRGLRVTAHIYGLDELVKAIAAGVDECAHVLMSPESIPPDVVDEMVRRDMVVVPTLSIFGGRARVVAIENVARFVAAGGRVAYGTDLGNEGPEPGIDRREIEGLVDAGYDGRSVIAAGTISAAQVAGFDRKGVLADGYDADVIAVSGDPLQRPRDLCNVTFVMREGRIVSA